VHSVRQQCCIYVSGLFILLDPVPDFHVAENYQMSHTVITPVAILALLALITPCKSDEATLEGKKLIKMFGLDKPTTAYLKEHIEEIESFGLDGVCVAVLPNKGTHELGPRDDGNYFWHTSIPQTREEYSDAVRDLNETNFQRMDYNIMQYATRGPQNPGWFDDEGWEILCENTRVAGWVVSQTPMVGITYDPEIGGGGVWNYARTAARIGSEAPTFEEYHEKVRRRGREWAEALTEAAPDIVIILAYGYTMVMPKVERDQASLHEVLQTSPNALWPAFIDGMLEGIGPDVELYDGGENTYPVMVYDTFINFKQLAKRMSEELSTVPHLVRSRLKFCNAVWPGFRSDNPGMWDPSVPEQNHYSPQRLSHALYNGLAASDKVTWIWSGRDVWWPPSIPADRKIGGDHNWGALTLYTEPFVSALNDVRTPKDLSWRPNPPDTGSYPAAALPAHSMEGYEVLADLPATWWFKTVPDNVIYDRADAYSGWMETTRANIDEAGENWRKLKAGSPWEEQGVPYNGIAMYRAHLTPGDSVKGRNLWLAFGGVGGEAHVYAAPKGARTRLLGKHKGTGPFLIDATGAFEPGKKSLVIIRVINREGPGGLLGPVHIVGKEGEEAYVPNPGNYKVLELNFQEGEGDRIADASEFKNHATNRGGEWADGPGDRKAIRLDGVSQRIAVMNRPVLNPWNGTRSWELWYSPGGAIPRSPILFHVLLAKHPRYQDGIYLDQHRSPREINFIQGETSQALTYPVGDVNAWYHIVGTYDGEEMKLYINGKHVGTRPAPVPPTISSHPVSLGGGATDASREAPGLFTRAAIYNYALTAQEVSDLYRTLNK